MPTYNLNIYHLIQRDDYFLHKGANCYKVQINNYILYDKQANGCLKYEIPGLIAYTMLKYNT